MKKTALFHILLFLLVNLIFCQNNKSIKLIVKENGETLPNLDKYSIRTYIYTTKDTLLIGQGNTINPPFNYDTKQVEGIIIIVNYDTLVFFIKEEILSLDIPNEIKKYMLPDFQDFLYQNSSWTLNMDYFPFDNKENQNLVDSNFANSELPKNDIIVYELHTKHNEKITKIHREN